MCQQRESGTHSSPPKHHMYSSRDRLNHNTRLYDNIILKLVTSENKGKRDNSTSEKYTISNGFTLKNPTKTMILPLTKSCSSAKQYE